MQVNDEVIFRQWVADGDGARLGRQIKGKIIAFDKYGNPCVAYGEGNYKASEYIDANQIAEKLDIPQS
jgi:hypothetical protein